MKKINKILILTLAVFGTLFYSCETTELEQVSDPNVLTPDKADADLLFNNIQLQYVAFDDVNGINRGVTVFNDLGAQLSRIDYFFGRNYFNNLGANTLNGPWGDLYSDMIPDIAAIESLNSEDNDLSFQIGASKAMQAHLMMLLVDFLGDIPYSQVGQPDEFPSPMLDDDADVYAAAIALLDEAGSLMDGADLGTATDLFYAGDAEKWVKYINTLKMRANLTTKNYSAVVAATNVIETMADDMEFKYGTNVQQPDNRHPDYIADYRSDGANNYPSNWLVDLMVGPVVIEGDSINGVLPQSDPRRRYYFYRQNAFTPGNITIVGNEEGDDFEILENGGNGETLQCSLQNVPAHLEFTPDEDIWCSVKLGYWGRVHGNNEGIPPDGFTRTASGVYPAGGRFDDNLDYVLPNPDPATQAEMPFLNYTANVGLGLGAGGQGIEPIILSSYVEFWRAEANLALGNTESAADAFEAGIRESIAKVTMFGPLDADADISLAPDADDIERFVELMVDNFEDAPAQSGLDGFGFPTQKDKWDILGEQFFVAMYGGGADAYNFVRRTGYPRTLSRNIEANPGTFPRSLLYPSNEITTNPNVSQRTDLSTQVFWDSGVTNPAN